MKYNLRATDMMNIVSGHVDFKDSSILDLGCGYGDAAKFALTHGSRLAVCVEKNPDNMQIAAFKCQMKKLKGRFAGIIGNVQSRDVFDLAMENNDWKNFDYGFFFSVFPYLERPWETLIHMRKSCNVSFVEVQYKGDGPGYIPGPEEMAETFERCGFSSSTVIGKTLIEGRDLYRDIWMCKENHETGSIG